MQGTAADGEALDFESEDDDLMDEEGAPDAEASPPHPKLKYAITVSSTLSVPKKTKGRGFRQDSDSAANQTRVSLVLVLILLLPRVVLDLKDPLKDGLFW